MFRTRTSFRLWAPTLLLAIIAAGCVRSTGDEPSTPTMPSQPAPTASPSTPPSEAPDPTEAPATPEPSEEPIAVVEFDPLTIARVTADDVAVRVLPGDDQTLVVGYDSAGGDAPEVRLSNGDTVAIIWGPIFVDDHTWYAVRSVDTGTVTWDEGWIAADSLVEEGQLDSYPLVAAADGLGSGTAESGTVSQHGQLYVNAVVTPMPGDDSCEAEVVVIGTDGTRVLIGSGRVSETTQFFSSPLENGDLNQEVGGTITLQVRSDCAWAAMAFEPPG